MTAGLIFAPPPHLFPISNHRHSIWFVLCTFILCKRLMHHEVSCRITKAVFVTRHIHVCIELPELLRICCHLMYFKTGLKNMKMQKKKLPENLICTMRRVRRSRHILIHFRDGLCVLFQLLYTSLHLFDRFDRFDL